MPAPDQQSDSICITGLASQLDRAKEGLLERVKELQAEQEDRVNLCQVCLNSILFNEDRNIDTYNVSILSIILSRNGLFLNRIYLLQVLRSYKLTMTVDPKYHPKIIGRKGAIITNIRTEHDVNIQFPEKNDESQV